MNEVVKVSIAGIGFIFDTEAYNELKAYLDRLENLYKGNADGQEIIADIEARIVEIILSRQPAEQVVGVELACEITRQMGLPENEQRAEEAGGGSGPEPTFPRRLYRNMDGAKLGGVCNGLATFFGIDPVWVRLSFFIPLFLTALVPVMGFPLLSGFFGTLFGVFFMLYFILWFAVPAARAPRQKLEMSGERITASSIEKHQRRRPENENPPRRSESALAELFSVFGKIILLSVKAFVLIIGFSLAIGAIGLLIGLFSLPFMDSIGDGKALEILDHMDGINGRGFVSLWLALGLIPLVALAYLSISLVFGHRVNRTIMTILGCTWLIVLIYTGVMSVRNREILREARYEMIHDMDSWDHRMELWEDKWERWEDRLEEKFHDRNYSKRDGRRYREKYIEDGVQNLIINGDTIIKDGVPWEPGQTRPNPASMAPNGQSAERTQEAMDPDTGGSLPDNRTEISVHGDNANGNL